MNVADVAFDCMGTEMRVICEGPRRRARGRGRARRGCATPTPGSRASGPDSELCALNADPRDVVPASPLLCAAVAAGRWAARADRRPRRPDARRRALPRRLRALARRRRPGAARGGARARPAAPARGPHPRRRWRAIVVDRARRHDPAARRASRIDTGGTGKGLAADAVAQRLAGVPRFAVDCGGDVHVGGAEAARRPFEVEVEHPLTGERRPRPARPRRRRRDLRDRQPDLAPRRTAASPTICSTRPRASRRGPACSARPRSPRRALKAETLAKAALLSGPDGARRVLAVGGGVIVHDDGDVELVGPVRAAAMPRSPLRLGGGAAA